MENDFENGIATTASELSLHERLIRRYRNAKQIADLWLALLQACYHYAIPFRNRFYLPTKNFQGTMNNARIYDTTLLEATKTFVSKIQDTVTPPQSQWGYLLADDNDNYDEKTMQEIQLQLNEYMRRFFVYLEGSNFDVVVNECYFDLAVGTACIVINEGNDDKPLVFTSMPIDKLSIEEAVNGKIESWFRTWEDMKISELHTRWHNITLSAHLITLMEGDPDAKVKVLYEGCIYFPNAEKPYVYAVWTNEEPLLYEWLDSKPGVVWRWQKINNETWGRGPVMDALPTAITLNEMMRIELASANLNVFKPYMGFSDNVFNPNTFRIQPFTVIPIAPIGVGSSPPLIPLGGSSDPNFAQMTLTDLRLMVKQMMYAETPMDQPGVQPQSVFELALKQQTLAQKIGPLFSRIEYEFIEPLYERCAYILNKMGLLPYPKFEGVKIRFKYKSPLALTKGQQDIARFSQYVQVMQGIMGPEITSIYINPRTTPYMLAEALHIDTRFLNNPDDVGQAMQSLQDKMSQEQLVNSSAETPQQPENPISQTVG